MNSNEKDVEYLRALFNDAKVDEHMTGHRERAFKGLETDSNFDFSSLSDVLLLELYLMTIIPRKDVKPIAYDLLETFGSLGAISKAELYELMQIDGIGLNTARNLIVVFPFCIRCCESTAQVNTYIRRPTDVVNFISPSYLGAIKELAYVIFLDNREKVLQYSLLNKGFVGQVRIDSVKILQLATKINAAKAILVHNHPSGDVTPSNADIVVTSRILSMLYRINIHLVDHIIIGKNGDYFSIMKKRSKEIVECLQNKAIAHLICLENLKENVADDDRMIDYAFLSNDLNGKLEDLSQISNLVNDKNQSAAEFNHYANTKFNEENFLDV